LAVQEEYHKVGNSSKIPKMVFCNILKFEITLTRCKPVKGLKQCESCKGYVLKPKKKSGGKTGRPKKDPS
jgi:hypothetical protein